MKKVLLLSCFICLTAHAGTGGGISTPPGRAGLANLLAEAIGLTGALFRLHGTEPLPEEIVLAPVPANNEKLDATATVDLSNVNGETRSYRVMAGDEADQLVLKDRRVLLRASVSRQP